MAFESFVDHELAKLLRFGYQLTGTRHDAWDLTQDALVRVGEHWGRLRLEQAGAQYARTTMVRLNINRWHRRRREILGELPERPVDSPAEQIPTLSSAVRTGLMELGPRQRTTVVLRHLYDMPLREIAETMGCSLGTVKSQLSRGEANLRQRLRPDPGSDPAPPPAAAAADISPSISKEHRDD